MFQAGLASFSPTACGLSVACYLSFEFLKPNSEPLERWDLADVFPAEPQVQCLLALVGVQFLHKTQLWVLAPEGSYVL